MSHPITDRSLSWWKFCVACECSAVPELARDSSQRLVDLNVLDSDSGEAEALVCLPAGVLW